MSASRLEDALALQIRALGLPEPVRQYRLPELPERKFVYDFAYPGARLVIEVQGGTWMARGGHNTGRGLERDCEKASLATVHGWRVLLVTAQQVRDGRAVEWINQCLGA